MNINKMEYPSFTKHKITLAMVLMLPIGGISVAGDLPGFLDETPAPLTPLSKVADGSIPFVSTMPEEFVPGEVLIKFTPGAKRDPVAIQRLMDKFGGELKTSHDSIGVDLYRLKNAKDKAATQRAIEALQKNPNVEFAEPNGIVNAIGDAGVNLTTNDPSFSSQYGLAQTFTPQAWNISTGSTSGYIAIVDTGVNWMHPDLNGKVYVPSTNYGNCVAPYTWPMDDNGHGTHVAGIAAAKGNNSTGIAGVAYSSRILAVKVLNSSGSGTWSQVACGINLAAAIGGVSSINLSLGGSGSSSTLYNAVYNAWVTRGKTVVAANGNSYGTTPNYPACYSLNGIAIAVGSTDAMTNRSSFSTYNSCTTVAAPGSSILSTYSTNYSSSNSYANLSGTSMASPHVAGIVALMQHNRPRSNGAVRSDLINTANGAGPVGWDTEYGWGIVDAYGAAQ